MLGPEIIQKIFVRRGGGYILAYIYIYIYITLHIITSAETSAHTPTPYPSRTIPGSSTNFIGGLERWDEGPSYKALNPKPKDSHNRENLTYRLPTLGAL